MSLSTLLITQTKADWLRSLQGLSKRFTKREMAKWWCQLNARSWPNDCPINQFAEEDEEWNQRQLFQALREAVNDEHYLTLHWQADWCAEGKIKRTAINELAHIDGSPPVAAIIES